MKIRFYVSILLLLAFVSAGYSGGQLSVVAEGAKVEKLAGGFRFTEGPAADAKGNIFFTDIPNNRIHKWSLEGKLSTFREKSGGSNGLYFDKKGNLLACEGGGRRKSGETCRRLSVYGGTGCGREGQYLLYGHPQ